MPDLPVLYWSAALANSVRVADQQPLDGLIYQADGKHWRVWHAGDRHGLRRLPADAQRLVIEPTRDNP